MRLRDSDIALARSSCHWTPHARAIYNDRGARALLAHLFELADDYDVSVVIKQKRSTRWARLSTTFYTQIRLLADWSSLTAKEKCAVLGHEFAHVRQWRAYGRAKFGFNYVFNPRYRWAMEMHGYRESVRFRSFMGLDVDNYISEKVERIPRLYALRASHVKHATAMLLREVA